MFILWSRFVRYGLVSLVVLGAGLGLGGLLAARLKAHQIKTQEAERKVQQKTQTAQILEQMKSIQVGDTLRDFTFEDLSGRPARLSEHVTELTWVAVIEPTCETCVNNVKRIKSVLPDSVSAVRFVFISGANPRDLMDLKDSVGIGSPFLYDHHRQWINGYKFNAFPFHMLVDRSLRIKDIVTGDLDEEKIRQVP